MTKKRALMTPAQHKRTRAVMRAWYARNRLNPEYIQRRREAGRKHARNRSREEKDRLNAYMRSYMQRPEQKAKKAVILRLYKKTMPEAVREKILKGSSRRVKEWRRHRNELKALHTLLTLKEKIICATK